MSRPEYRSLVQFRQAAKRGNKLTDALLLKDAPGAPQILSDRQFRFTISTGTVDRQQDTVAVGGWDLKAFLRNPVVLWGHGMDPTVGTMSIGRAFDIGPEGGALRASVEFDPPDMPVSGPVAEACVRKLRNKSLSAVSVGFRPLDFDVTDDPARGGDGWLPGVDFKRQELLEFSVVAVPANPEALVDPVSNLLNEARYARPGLVKLTNPERIAANVRSRDARRRTERLLGLEGGGYVPPDSTK